MVSLHCCGSHCIASSALQIALLFCSPIIGLGVGISFAQSEHNGSFNGNHGKPCAQSSYGVLPVTDDDLLSCINMLWASWCLFKLLFGSCRLSGQCSILKINNKRGTLNFYFCLTLSTSSYMTWIRRRFPLLFNCLFGTPVAVRKAISYTRCKAGGWWGG